MIGYYANWGDGTESLTVPGSFIAHESYDEFKVDYHPARLEALSILLDKGKLLMLERCIMAGLVEKVDIPNKDLRELNEYCFNSQPEQAFLKAKQIFNSVKRRLEYEV